MLLAQFLAFIQFRDIYTAEVLAGITHCSLTVFRETLVRELYQIKETKTVKVTGPQKHNIRAIVLTDFVNFQEAPNGFLKYPLKLD